MPSGLRWAEVAGAVVAVAFLMISTVVSTILYLRAKDSYQQARIQEGIAQKATQREFQIRRQAETMLYESLINESRSRRLACESGWRPVGFDKLKQAADLVVTAR